MVRSRRRASFAQTGGRPFDPSLQTVVRIHGAGMDQTVWQQQSRYLAHHGWNVLAVDLPDMDEAKARHSVRSQKVRTG